MNFHLKILDTKAGKREYLKFRKDLYSNDPGYVFTEEFIVEMLLYQTTEFTKRCDIRPVVVYENDKMVCQAMFISAPDTADLQISYFESLENKNEAVDYMLKEAELIAKSNGQTQIIIGLNGHLSYGVGILIDGFNKNSFDSHYNKPYYHDYFKMIEHTEQLTSYGDKIPNTAAKIREPKADPNIYVRNINLNKLRDEMEIFRNLCDQTLGTTRLYMPTDNRHFYELIKDMKPLLKPENILFVCNDGWEVGFLFWYPDYNEILEAGRIYSAGTIAFNYLVNKNKIKTVKINAIGVLKEYRNIAVMMLLAELKKYIFGKYETIETNFVWNSNIESTRLNNSLMSNAVRKYNIYIKKVN